jgi:glucosamine 6-phosphate synthetase-like amidotransferase/phosphosugar isomerase protein
MCGIVGIATKQNNGFTNAEGDMFRDMLYLDAFRGWDSTGVFGVDKNGSVQIHKEASEAAQFIKTKEFKEFKSSIVSRGLFAVGRKRAATRGEINDRNAHPFNIDDKIVLVQNGTWHGDHKKVKDTEVDTEALAHIIADNEDVETALQKVQAAYSLCWFNTATNSLYLVRNSMRPMWMAETMSGTIVWASEPGFIQLAAMRNTITLKEKPVLLDEHVLVKFEIKNNNWVCTKTKVNPFRQFQSYEEDDTSSVRPKQWPNGPWLPQQQQQVHTRPTLSLPHSRNVSTIPADRTKVDKPFSDVAFELIADAAAPSTMMAAQCQAAWRERIAEKRKCIVELEDYISANNHKDCNTWHVWGRAIDPEGHPATYGIVHWFVYNKTEGEVMQYVSGFYEFVPAHTKKEEYVGNTEIVTIMANSNSCIKLESDETVVQ